MTYEEVLELLHEVRVHCNDWHDLDRGEAVVELLLPSNALLQVFISDVLAISSKLVDQLLTVNAIAL